MTSADELRVSQDMAQVVADSMRKGAALLIRSNPKAANLLTIGADTIDLQGDLIKTLYDVAVKFSRA